MDAYKLTSEMATTEEYAQQNEYAHSLFVADYAVTRAVSWDNLHAEKLIFGKDYAAGSVEYTMRAPSGGSGGMFSFSYSWGQDTLPNSEANRVVRGYDSPRKFAGYNTTLDPSYLVFRPVLEVLNPDTLGTDGLKAVTLDLGGGKLGGSSEEIKIIVKKGSDGKLYAPGDNVPADVTSLTAQFDDSGTYTVTITTDRLPDGKVGEAYSQTLTADGTAPIIWSISSGTASASHAKAAAGREITLTATPNTGYRFKEWEVISGGVAITNNKFTIKCVLMPVSLVSPIVGRM